MGPYDLAHFGSDTVGAQTCWRRSASSPGSAAFSAHRRARRTQVAAGSSGLPAELLCEVLVARNAHPLIALASGERLCRGVSSGQHVRLRTDELGCVRAAGRAHELVLAHRTVVVIPVSARSLVVLPRESGARDQGAFLTHAAPVVRLGRHVPMVGAARAEATASAHAAARAVVSGASDVGRPLRFDPSRRSASPELAFRTGRMAATRPRPTAHHARASSRRRALVAAAPTARVQHRPQVLPRRRAGPRRRRAAAPA
jgi:hypothetical protein